MINEILEMISPSAPEARHDLTYPDFPEYGVVKKGGRQTVLYDPARNQFLKVDKRPDGTILEKEAVQIRASIHVARPELPLSTVNGWVRLQTIPDGEGRLHLATQSRYLGVNTLHAARQRLILADRIPPLTSQVFDTAERILELTGVWNEDLNASNILLHGRNGIIIIDWVSSTSPDSPITVRKQATSMAKFIHSLGRKDVTTEQILDQTKHTMLEPVLEEIVRREDQSAVDQESPLFSHPFHARLDRLRGV